MNRIAVSVGPGSIINLGMLEIENHGTVPWDINIPTFQQLKSGRIEETIVIPPGIVFRGPQ